jgi:Secretion system C-terminal sorting domain/PKD domain
MVLLSRAKRLITVVNIFNMRKLFTLLALAIVFSMNAQTKSALFVGNSYTYVNNLPQMVKDLALSKGDTLLVDVSAVGGYTFNNHSVYAPTLNKIKQQAWDYVILQEQSQLPSFPPSQVATDVYPYADKLNDSILQNNACTETLFFMTWGRQNGDASNCAFYPPLCTYNGMQMRLRSSYMQMAADNHASVAPVGVAWKIARDSMPSTNFYDSDGSHPSIYGSYLSACVFYASIYHKQSFGALAPSAITASDASKIQQIADFTVLDSLNYWQDTGDVPNSNFSANISGNSVSFQNQSSVNNIYQWNFGDGNNATGINPAHAFLPGTYTVTCTASNACKSFTTAQVLVIVPTFITEQAFDEVGVYPNPAHETLTLSTKYQVQSIKMYNVMGECVLSQQLTTNNQQLTFDLSALPSGVYFIEATTEKGAVRKKFVKASD